MKNSLFHSEKKQAIKHLEKYGCILLREGANHSIYQNPDNKQQSAVGRHRELSDLLCKKICRQLEIPEIK